MTPFAISLPGRVVFGRGTAAQAPTLAFGFGDRGVVIHGADPSRAQAVLGDFDARILPLSCPSEPSLLMLETALSASRGFGASWVMAIGGGAVIDMGKALAAMLSSPTPLLHHLEVVGQGLPLNAEPLPFIALPTTAGTGAEATRNAVIGLPEHGRKVSMRDPAMMANIAIIDPSLTDHTPLEVTLASGLDAVTQVIEPYISHKATAFTDAIARPAIGQGIRALQRLCRAEDAKARDAMAWVSLSGGMALANGGLGAVHGLAGVIGGLYPAPHGAVCGALLGPVLAANHARASGDALRRINDVLEVLGEVFGCASVVAPKALADWAHDHGLARLSDMGVKPAAFQAIAAAALGSSSMRGNPVALSVADLCAVMAEA